MRHASVTPSILLLLSLSLSLSLSRVRARARSLSYPTDDSCSLPTPILHSPNKCVYPEEQTSWQALYTCTLQPWKLVLPRSVALSHRVHTRVHAHTRTHTRTYIRTEVEVCMQLERMHCSLYRHVCTGAVTDYHFDVDLVLFF